MQRTKHSIFSTALLIASLGAFAACGDDDDDDDGQPNIDGGAPDGSAPNDGGATDGGVPGPTQFAISTYVYSPEATSNASYLSFAPNVELGGAKIDKNSGREFPGLSDVWVLGNYIYVSSGDAPTITRYTRDAGGALVPATPTADDQISFAGEGVKSSAFWNNVFISPTKAYMNNGADELIVWNPATMKIEPEKKIEIPGIVAKGAQEAKAGYSDRSSVLYNGKLYRTIYWSEEFSTYAGESKVVVIDTATDEVVTQIDVPCGNLDYGTVTEDGKLFFSNWTFAAGAAVLVANHPPTCFSQIDPGSNTVVSTVRFADVSGGYEGAALRYLGDGTFAFSRMDLKRGDTLPAGSTTPLALTGNPIFSLWSYKLGAQPTPVEGIGKNSGAVYEARVKGQQWALIPGEGQKETTAYRLVGGNPSKAFVMDGWVLRLFGYPN